MRLVLHRQGIDFLAPAVLLRLQRSRTEYRSRPRETRRRLRSWRSTVAARPGCVVRRGRARSASDWRSVLGSNAGLPERRCGMRGGSKVCSDTTSNEGTISPETRGSRGQPPRLKAGAADQPRKVSSQLVQVGRPAGRGSQRPLRAQQPALQQMATRCTSGIRTWAGSPDSLRFVTESVNR